MLNSKSFWKLSLCLILFLGFMAGCTSGQKTEDGETPPGETAASGDAQTDAVPPDGASASAETPPADPAAETPPAEATTASTEKSEEPPPATDQPPAEENKEVVPSVAEPEKVAETPPIRVEEKKAEPAPVTASSGFSGGNSYTVQTGDTLMKIAFEVYGDLYQWRSIYNKNKNKIKNPSGLPKGLVLALDPAQGDLGIERNGEKYLIKIGDTLGKISNQVYGTAKKWKELWQNNKKLIRDPNKIFAGFYLYYSSEGKILTNAARAVPKSAKTRSPAGKK